MTSKETVKKVNCIRVVNSFNASRKEGRPVSLRCRETGAKKGAIEIFALESQKFVTSGKMEFQCYPFANRILIAMHTPKSVISKWL